MNAQNLTFIKTQSFVKSSHFFFHSIHIFVWLKNRNRSAVEHEMIKHLNLCALSLIQLNGFRLQVDQQKLIISMNNFF